MSLIKPEFEFSWPRMWTSQTVESAISFRDWKVNSYHNIYLRELLLGNVLKSKAVRKTTIKKIK